MSENFMVNWFPALVIKPLGQQMIAYDGFHGMTAHTHLIGIFQPFPRVWRIRDTRYTNNLAVA